MKYKCFFLFAVVCVALLSVSTWSVCEGMPATAKIAFSSRRGGNLDIYLMNPDGSEEVRLTHDLANDRGPKWSPTGEHILFISDRDTAIGDWDLYLMDADGSNIRRVFKKEANRDSPTWSPDGKQIAYVRWEQGKFFIYIAPIDGKKEERIALGSQPAWSPDGTEIAFIEGAPGDPKRISMLDVETHKYKFFFPPKAPAWVRHHTWSPSGEKLAFAWYNRVEFRKEDFKLETIYIVNRDGTGLQQVIEEGKRSVEPRWSPRGDELIYSQLDQNDMQQIFKVTLGGDKAVQITNPNFQHFVGDWFDPAFALPVAPQPNFLTTTWGQVKQK